MNSPKAVALAALPLIAAAIAFSLLIPTDPVEAEARSLTERLGRLPLAFERNDGQVAESVDFLARAPGYSLFLASGDATLVLGSGSVVRMELVGATAEGVEGREKLPGKASWLVGNDPERWRRGVPLFRQVRYRSIYPGVDLVYYGNPRTLEYDFILAAGAEPDHIALRFTGMDSLATDEAGDLLLATPAGDLRLRRPVAYQEGEGGRVEVDCAYEVRAGGLVSFRLGRFDPDRPLVIDPVVEYATYLGDSLSDRAFAVAADGAGNLYMTGETSSYSFPTTDGSGTNGLFSSSLVFVTKISATGGDLVYSTCIGGEDDNWGQGIAVDASGSVTVVGRTDSRDFPVWKARQGARGGGYDAFVLKIDSAGTHFVYSTYLGGGRDDWGRGVALDGSGNAYVVGETASSDFPTSSPLQASFGGDHDAFVTKISADGSTISYSTYLGGARDDRAVGVAVDGSGNAYLVGYTESTDFPTVAAYQAAHGGRGMDAFVAKVLADGSGLAYSTYLGGSGEELLRAVAVDAAGSAYVTGACASSGWPTRSPIQASNRGGESDAVVAKLAPDGASLVYSTYLGGPGADWGAGIAVTADGRAVVGGATGGGIPMVDRLQTSYGGGSKDVLVFTLDPTGTTLLLSTNLGGSDEEAAEALALDPDGNIYVVGMTESANFPTTSGAVQEDAAGRDEVFAVKIGFPLPPPATHVTVGSEFTVEGTGFPTKKAKVRLFPIAGAGKKGKLKAVSTSGGRIVARVKKAAAGEYRFQVRIDKDWRAFGEPVIVSLPENVSCTPGSGAPRAQVTLTGELFGTKKGKVKVGGKKAKVVSWTDTRVVVRIGKKAPAGPADIEIRNKVGTITVSGAFVVD